MPEAVISFGHRAKILWVCTRAAGILGVVVAALLFAASCSSVSICLEQEKGVSASDDARASYEACKPNPPR